MVETLQNLLDNSQMPIFSAFIMGLLTAISPCQLATNITAIGYISKDVDHPHRIFLNGILYTIGRILSYSLLGIVLIGLIRSGAETFSIQKEVSIWGERLLPPAFLLIGLFLLFGNRLSLSQFGFSATEKTEKLKGKWGSLLLGLLLAMAFCPTSGFFYFGMLIPMSVLENGGYLYPVVFALATGLPVVIVAWLLAYSLKGLKTFYAKTQKLQRVLTHIVAVLFIIVGVYYGYMIYC